jgi:hypothetical protein
MTGTWVQWQCEQSPRSHVYYTLVPFNTPKVPSSTGPLVTEYWIERCMFEDKLCDPTSCPIYQPLQIEIPVPGKYKLRGDVMDELTFVLGMHRYTIGLCGAPDRLFCLHIERLVKTLGQYRCIICVYIHIDVGIGGKFQERLSAEHTHLICLDTTSEDYTLAVNCGIDVVGPEWLYAIARLVSHHVQRLMVRILMKI